MNKQETDQSKNPPPGFVHFMSRNMEVVYEKTPSLDEKLLKLLADLHNVQTDEIYISTNIPDLEFEDITFLPFEPIKNQETSYVRNLTKLFGVTGMQLFAIIAKNPKSTVLPDFLTQLFCLEALRDEEYLKTVFSTKKKPAVKKAKKKPALMIQGTASNAGKVF